MSLLLEFELLKLFSIYNDNLSREHIEQGFVL